MADTIAVGTEIGGYRVTGLIDQGRLGVVYRAEQVSTGRQVALKVLLPELSADEETRRRFLREVRYAAALDHPSVARLLDSGEADGLLYLALEYVSGEDLGTLLLREGALEPAYALALLGQVAAALDAAHARGILHRDVNPGNILVGESLLDDGVPRCYLEDFGLGKEPTGDSAALTAPGSFVGTPDYTAPEQILGRDCDHRIDVYALGCVLYQCLVGALPFARERTVDVLYAHIEEPPPRLSDRRADLAPLDEVVARAMAKDRDRRFASCGALVDAARAVISPPVLRLEVVAGKVAGTHIDVDRELIIGRHAPGEGRLGDDADLSRRHARISRAPDRTYAIEDLGSTNGTCVNGRRIEGAEPLSPGDRVDLGDTSLVVVVAPPKEPPAPAGMPVRSGAAPAPPAEAAHREEAGTPAPAAPHEPAPAAPGRGPPDSLPWPSHRARFSLRLEVDWEAREIDVALDGAPDAAKVVCEDGRWRVEPSPKARVGRRL